jgi:predicted nucleotidyltransferase
MRISEKTLNIIKENARRFFGEDCEIRIFGSRTDNRRRGGDIDIYIESSKEIDMETRARFLSELKLKIGDQKIDLIIQKKGMPPEGSIHEHAKMTGIKI